MKRVFGALTLCLWAVLPVAAQPAERAGGALGRGLRERTPLTRGAVALDEANAQETLRRFQELLQQYPPSLSRVLSLDPTLLLNEAYLQPYPQLATFISQHPDIAHNPLESGSRALSAPFGRILWSVQAGVVIAFLGVGLIYASRRLVGNDIFSAGELPVFVLGCAAVAIGAGFFISAIAAYVLSHRL